MPILGCVGGSEVERLPLAQGVILESCDPRVSVSFTNNKILKKKKKPILSQLIDFIASLLLYLLNNVIK